jgi:hypothetical protein
LLAKAAAGVIENHLIGQAGQHRRIVSLYQHPINQNGSKLKL